jgi:hypothetical protein
VIAVFLHGILLVLPALLDNDPAIAPGAFQVRAEATIITDIPGSDLLKAVTHPDQLAIFAKKEDKFRVFAFNRCNNGSPGEKRSDLGRL